VQKGLLSGKGKGGERKHVKKEKEGPSRSPTQQNRYLWEKKRKELRSFNRPHFRKGGGEERKKADRTKEIKACPED